jgi:hypothetical protein
LAPVAETHRLRVRRLERVELGQLEELGHQPRHGLDILLDLLGDPPIRQGVEIGGEHGQRGQQFVGGIGGELPLGIERLVQAVEGGIDRGDQGQQFGRHAVGGKANARGLRTDRRGPLRGPTRQKHNR